MACFLVSALEGVIVTAVEKSEAKKEEKKQDSVDVKDSEQIRISLSRKLRWLASLLFGGAVLLAFEHIWHGEVVPWFPFLTAMSSPEDAAEMFYEMATVGVCMAVLITVVWMIMCKVADSIARRSGSESAENTAH